MWRRYYCLTSFFPIENTYLSCEDMARQSCGMVRRWRFFASFLRPVFSASRVQHISDMHSKFALRPHHVAIQTPTAGIRRGKKEERKKKPQGKYMMSASATQGCHNKCVSRLARHKYHHTALRYAATPNSERPPSHGAQFRLPHCHAVREQLPEKHAHSSYSLIYIKYRTSQK